MTTGFYGTNLKFKNDDMFNWLSFDSLFKHTPALRSTISKIKNMEIDTSYISSTMIQKLGMFNLSGNLVKDLQKLQKCTSNDENSSFRVHSFGYDWRNELQKSSESLNSYVNDIYATNGNKPVHVIARIE